MPVEHVFTSACCILWVHVQLCLFVCLSLCLSVHLLIGWLLYGKLRGFCLQGCSYFSRFHLMYIFFNVVLSLVVRRIYYLVHQNAEGYLKLYRSVQHRELLQFSPPPTKILGSILTPYRYQACFRAQTNTGLQLAPDTRAAWNGKNSWERQQAIVCFQPQHCCCRYSTFSLRSLRRMRNISANSE